MSNLSRYYQKTYPSFYKRLCILLDTVSFDCHFYNNCKQPQFYNNSISFDDSSYEVASIYTFCEAGITIVEDIIDIQSKSYISDDIFLSRIRINLIYFSNVRFISSTCMEKFYQILL